MKLPACRSETTTASWHPVQAGEPILLLPSELFRLSAFVPATASGCADVELSLAGLHTAPAAFALAQSGYMVVASLTPLAVVKAFGAPLGGIVNARILIGELCPPESLASLAASLRRADSPPESARLFAQWIDERIRHGTVPGLRAQRAARAAMLLADPDAGYRHVADLAEEWGITQRQFERDFSDWFGVAPATYRRLARFQHAAGKLSAGEAAASVAADCGFADQAHLTRAVRSMALLTPRRLQAHGSREAPALLRNALDGRLLFMRGAGEEIDPAQIAALQPGCPLRRLLRSAAARLGQRFTARSKAA